MNDTNDLNQAQSEANVGFCQNCGKPLTTDMVRKVGPSVYCEPCLAARIGDTAQAGYAPGYGTGYGPVNAGAGPGVNAGAGPAYGTDGWFAQNLGKPGPNPGLAALLGLIPGVGAMYNEQYAKGIVHLVVFAVLVSLADNVNGIFGLFVAGWVFYMAIEAHHTARARRDGTVLPNPFGLNDIGERLGFGRSWPTGPSVTEVASDAAAAAQQGFQQARAPYPPPYPAAQGWGAPSEVPVSPNAPGAAPNQAAYAQVPYSQPAYAEQIHQQAYRDAGYVPPAGAYGAGYQTVPPYDPAAFVPQPSRFPAGAVWLIGLGSLFLLTTTGIFNGFPAEALIGCILLGVAVWVFLRRMLESGTGIANDGTTGYPVRLVSALRFPIWLAILGLLFLLDSFHVVTWHHSWPLLVILAGVMALLQRAAFQASVPSYIAPPPVAATAATSESTDLTKGGY